MLPNSFDTARLVLRPIAAEDADVIFNTYAQDEEVTRYVIWRPHKNLGETRAYIEHCIATPHDIERTYVLVGKGDNIIRGAFALRQRALHRLDCGYVLARRWWQQGLMTEALSEITAWGLCQPSIFRVLGKSGFVREGMLRRWLVHPNVSDEPRDCYSYARVR